jgi:hypothetical protein
MVPRRIRHLGVCTHPQTPYARRKCRAAKIAAAAKATPAIRTIQREDRRRSWRGHEIVTITKHAEITGIVTGTSQTDTATAGLGHLPRYTIDAGGRTITVINPSVVADDMRPVRTGDRIVVIADEPNAGGEYCATSITRAA